MIRKTSERLVTGLEYSDGSYCLKGTVEKDVAQDRVTDFSMAASVDGEGGEYLGQVSAHMQGGRLVLNTNALPFEHSAGIIASATGLLSELSKAEDEA